MKNNKAPDLKPCPFCGSGAFISWDGDVDKPNDWSAVCDNTLACGATVQGMLSEEATVVAWNTRAASLQPPLPQSEETAAQIVREWAEHDLDEHYNGDYLRDTLHSAELEERIASALTSAQQR